MHATEHHAPPAALFSAVDPAAEEEKRQKRDQASGTRNAAYERLKLSEQERAAMEWACPKRMRPELDGLRAFFDQSESLQGEQQVAAWLNGPLFHGATSDQLKAAIMMAVGQHEKWEREVRRADLAEVRIVWFLRFSLLGLALACAIHLMTR